MTDGPFTDDHTVTYVTVATPSPRRWFDLDAVRTPYAPITLKNWNCVDNGPKAEDREAGQTGHTGPGMSERRMTHAGAPPLDWHRDNPDSDPKGTGGMSTVTLHVGDVHERLAAIPDGSVELIVTSPPFLALRSYLPADHPDKHREIGSEPTPAAFLDTLLALTAEWRRVLAPHGSLCVELGDTYSGSGGAGGDYQPGGWREGEPGFAGSMKHARIAGEGMAHPIMNMDNKQQGSGPGWPLSKSLTGIPHAYLLSLIYGYNVLDRHAPDSPAGRWRARNYLVWARPNPPVGAVGDKFRPACSYITVACTGPRRWFDLDGVRTELKYDYQPYDRAPDSKAASRSGKTGEGPRMDRAEYNPAGAPPLDWHSDCDDGPTGDRLWQMSTAPYKGAHYATYPLELPLRLIKAMCPAEVCRVCGKPRERITMTDRVTPNGKGGKDIVHRLGGAWAARMETITETLGWSDCGHGLLECANCGESIPYATRRPGSETPIPTRLVAETRLGAESEVSERDLRSVRGDVLRPEDSTDVQPEMWGSLGGDGGASELVSEEVGPLHEQSRLRDAVPAGTPDGDRERSEVGSGTSPCDVRTDGPTADQRRTGPPSERRSARQQAGESGTSGTARSPRTGRVPPLPPHIQPSVGTCPTCRSSAFVYRDNYRPGIVLDPFLGSGTTAVAAALTGRDSIGIDLDGRNTGLVNQRLAEKVHITSTNYVADRTVTREAMDAPMYRDGYLRNDGRITRERDPKGSVPTEATTTSATEIVWSCDAPLPDQRDQIEGQTNLFDMLEAP